jgi:hypothetical protein
MCGWGCAETRRSTEEAAAALHTSGSITSPEGTHTSPSIAGTVPVSDVTHAASALVTRNAVEAGVARAPAPRGVLILPKLPGPIRAVSGGVQPEGGKKRGRKRGGINAGLEFDVASKTTRWRRWKAQGGQAVLDAIGATTSTGQGRIAFFNLAMALLSCS